MGDSGPELVFPGRPDVSSTEPVTPADESALERYGAELARTIEAALGPWIEATVGRIVHQQLTEVPTELSEAAVGAGEMAAAEIVPMMRSLLSADIDRQTTTPLELLRRAGRHATRVLHEAEVPPVARDRFEVERFPDDVFGVGPATFGEVSADVHDAAVVWGAAKAYVHRARHEAPPR